MSVQLDVPVPHDERILAPRYGRGREWLVYALLSAASALRRRLPRGYDLRELRIIEKGLYYLHTLLRRTHHREAQILRLAEVLRAIERRVDRVNRPCTTPSEVHRALEDVRLILASTGKPWPGKCPRCGTVAMARPRRCPVCDLTEPDGVERSKSRHWRRW